MTGPDSPGIDGFLPDGLAVFERDGQDLLLALGQLNAAGGVPAKGIATWDGSNWDAFPSPYGSGVSGQIFALETFDDGGGPAVFGGGDFTVAGGTETRGIARWDGQSWQALGAGLGSNDTAKALAIFDDGGGPALYVGGTIETAGGLEAHNIAKWDGLTWSTLAGPSGTGTDGEIRALASFDDGNGAKLYVGGQFSSAGGAATGGLATWDGASWSAIPSFSPSGTVATFEIFDGGDGEELWVGGSFSVTGSSPSNSIARWSGSWISVNENLAARVDDFAVFDDGSGPSLYRLTDRVAEWLGNSDWSNIGNLPAAGSHLTLEAFDDGTGEALWLGGFANEEGRPLIRRWNGADWEVLEPWTLNNRDTSVFDLHPFDNGNGSVLLAGGNFRLLGGKPASGFGEWLSCNPDIFADGFESGDFSAWTSSSP